MAGGDRPIYVFLPLAEERCWVVPQRCLAEIVTVAAADSTPPESIQWRGQAVPVVDYGSRADPAWQDPRFGTGMIAVMLGLKTSGCPVWGVALRRGELLAAGELVAEDVEEIDVPEGSMASAVFRYQGQVCEVPDLVAIQKGLVADNRIAGNMTEAV